MIYIKIILLKIARYIAVMVWNIIRFFRWNKNINLKDIKKIIFNRKDRIWDAVVTKPFIILFSKYLKEELKLNIEIEVECSKYNEFVFKEWNWEKYYTLTMQDREISSTWMNIWNFMITYIKSRFWGLKRKIKSKKIKKIWIVYVDLVWDIESIIKNLKKWFYFIWSNMLINNYLLDYSLKNNYVSWNSDNLVQSYINLVSWCFNLNDFEKYINDNIEEFFWDYNYSKDKNWILVSIWNKEYRNLDIKVWVKLIKDLSKKHPNKEIKVIDDNTNILYQKLKLITDFQKNVGILENRFSLSEFKDYAKNFELLIWIDGWGFNYIRTVSNSITIYTIWNHNVWSIFTWKNKYKKSNLWNNWMFDESEVNWKSFWFIHKKLRLLPTYDIEIPKIMFNDFPINNINSNIWKILSK